jgi:hypothetical protein
MGVKRILVLAANPSDTVRLRLEQEVKEIRRSLRRSRLRDRFQLDYHLAVTNWDWRRALLETEPHILHFCGHGDGVGGLALESEKTGSTQLLSTDAIAGLLSHCEQLECVLLNACYSEVQAQAVVPHAPVVVGMQQAIGDDAALEFAVGFYDALGAGRDYNTAFEVGRTAIQAANLTEDLTPVLISNAGLDPAVRSKTVFISYRAQAPDLTLAQTFYQELYAAGHQPFLAGSSLQLGDNWPQRILAELEKSDYFLLLLSPESIASEMVMEEMQRAKELQELRGQPRPILLPIRVNFPLSSPLTYRLRDYLDRIQQREWSGPDDTDAIVTEVVKLVNAGEAPAPVAAPETPPLFQDSPDQPPLPLAEPELQREPGGTVPLTSALYMERYGLEGRAGRPGQRTLEAECFEEILQPGALIRIKAPRQMGKTSLMVRINAYAEQHGCKAIPLSLQQADGAMFTDFSRLMKWFCTRVGRRLKRAGDLADYWDEDLGVKDRCNDYFQDCLLEESDTPLVLALDEVDQVFPHQAVADDFFALLRSWYEAARYGDFNSELWAKLRLVVVHSTEVYVPLEINQSPFNVGKNVELPEFTPDRVQELAHRHGLTWGASQVEELMDLIGGHPYLLRKGLYHLRRQDLSLADLIATAPTEAGIYGDHLRRHLTNLVRYPDLAAACREVMRRNRPVDLDANVAYRLESMGVIWLQGNEAIPRNQVYRQYFREHLRGAEP